MFSRQEAWLKPIREIRDWRLDLKCTPCNRVVEFWVRHVAVHHADREFGEVLWRLRCRECGAKPSAALLANQRMAVPGKIWQDMNLDWGLVQALLWEGR